MLNCPQIWVLMGERECPNRGGGVLLGGEGRNRLGDWVRRGSLGEGLRLCFGNRLLGESVLLGGEDLLGENDLLDLGERVLRGGGGVRCDLVSEARLGSNRRWEDSCGFNGVRSVSLFG